LGGLVRLAARDRTDAAVAKPETPFVRVDELGADLRDVVGGAARHQKYPLSLALARPLGDHLGRPPAEHHHLSRRSRRGPNAAQSFLPLAGR
jgi:hypothetical protein